jgi:outer membrane protein assembly factor BamB
MLWKGADSLVSAALGDNTIYGITQDGFAAAYSASAGTARWTTATTYVPGRLAVSGRTIYGFQLGVGLMSIADKGTSAAELNLYKISTLSAGTMLSQPVPMQKLVHFVLDNRLLAVDASAGSVKFSLDLSGEGPYSLYTLGDDLLAVSGTGRPTRLHVNTGSYSTVWSAGLGGGADRTERTALVTDTLAVVAVPGGVAAYNAANGRLLWSTLGAGNLALAIDGGTLYCAGDRAGVWSLDLSNGAVLWERQYLAFVSRTSRVGLAIGDKCLWVGAMLDDGAEPAALWALNLEDGSFIWQATGVTLTYGNGLPLVAGGRVYSYGSLDPLTAMGGLNGVPAVTQANIRQTPNPLRGPMSGFNPVEVSVKLDIAASVEFIPWHERDVRNNGIGPIPFQAGSHTISYNAQFPRGWTDINQFGRLAFDIKETQSGLNYTVVMLVPVNTLPDIQHHWARQSIEAMIYHQYIGGYPDLTFRPNNLVTRAESSAIIAKTLGLEHPTAGFHTKFTDIGGHWARSYITALEEKDIVGGFQEADGTFTFRPNLNMTRAQDAKILVKAYNVTAAPASFQTKFTDIAGHWAEPFIKALEFKGYASGFREADGTFTYRPERNLTRAELSTLVVRIMGLTR